MTFVRVSPGIARFWSLRVYVRAPRNLSERYLSTDFSESLKRHESSLKHYRAIASEAGESPFRRWVSNSILPCGLGENLQKPKGKRHEFFRLVRPVFVHLTSGYQTPTREEVRPAVSGVISRPSSARSR